MILRIFISLCRRDKLLTSGKSKPVVPMALQESSASLNENVKAAEQVLGQVLHELTTLEGTEVLGSGHSIYLRHKVRDYKSRKKERKKKFCECILDLGISIQLKALR